MSAQPVPRLTPEEYLALDRAAEYKSEYLDGEVCAMSGGTLVHSMLAARLVIELDRALAGRGCRIMNSDARVRATTHTYTYPDLSVVCGQLETDGKDILLNPTTIAEVLSESTERFDRGLKFQRYRKIASLREYILVSQSKPMVEVFFRQPDGFWTLREYSGLDSTAELPSLGVNISLRSLYRDVELPETEAE